MSGRADELRAAIAREGCPICRVLRADEERYWDTLLYEGFQDPGVIRAYRAAVGLCARHLAQLGGRHDGFAAARLAQASLQGAIDAVEHARGDHRRGKLPLPGRRCPACKTLGRYESDAVDTLAQLLASDVAMRERFATSDGVCLAHLGQALEHRHPASGLLCDRFLAVAAERAGAVQRFLDAHEYRSSPPSPEQARSWRRAFASLRDAPGRLGDGRT